MTFFKRMFFSISAFIVLVVGSFSFSFATEAPSSSIPVIYWPFASLPTGYFDGDINAADSGYSISFSGSSNGSSSSDVDLESESSGVDRYSITVPSTSSTIRYTEGNSVVTNGWWNWTSGSVYYEDQDSYAVPGNYDNAQSPEAPWDAIAQGSPSGGFGYTETHGAGSGTVSTGSYTETVVQTASANEDITGDIDTTYLINSSFTGYISPNSDNVNHRRYRAFWFTRRYSGSDYYVYVISDARNRITSNQVFSGADGLTFRFWFSGGYDLFYFALDSSGAPASLNWEVGSSGDAVYFGCYSTRWSFSSDSPVIRNLDPSSLVNSFLTTSVFGEVAQTHYLIGRLHNDLTSLQTSMQSSITNQTNTMMNADAASGFDPTSVSNMLEYGSLESTFNAPSTNDLFSLSGGSYTDGMGFWRDRMNEVLFFNGSPILPMTIFSLTLGLAVLVIGRRVSGGGSA